jgi:hypothetical protein
MVALVLTCQVITAQVPRMRCRTHCLLFGQYVALITSHSLIVVGYSDYEQIMRLVTQFN